MDEDTAYVRYLEALSRLAIERQARTAAAQAEYRRLLNETTTWFAEEIRPFAVAAGIQRGKSSKRPRGAR